MERLSDVDEERIEELRAERASNLSVREKQHPAEERRDRDVVAYAKDAQGEWVETPLKRDDDVSCGGAKIRVVGPAPGRDFFYGYRKHDVLGELLVVCNVAEVLDRAPKEPEEAPMPLVPTSGTPPAAEELDALRQDAFKKIDQRSAELIAKGFTYEGIVFSASLEAQARYNGMMAFIDTLPYPIGINSLDDTENLPLADADAVRAFCMTALVHIKTIVDTGSVEKQRVRDMQDVASLQAYEDPRQVA